MSVDWSLAGKTVWWIFIVAWVALRWRPNVRARRHRVKNSRRTLIEQVSLTASFSGLFFVPVIWMSTRWFKPFSHDIGPVSVAIGSALLIASLILFHLTHRALGSMWSNSLDLRHGHRLITTSVYTHLRHPMYTAFWLWAVAQIFLFSNWISGLSGVVGFGLLFFLRVGKEEQMMEAEFGDEYRAYAKRTKKILPWIF